MGILFNTFYLYKKTCYCIIFALLSLFHVSCFYRTDLLENALQQADDNRSELEKVLMHFSQTPIDSLKYRAACFLIANMPGHISKFNVFTRSLKSLDSIDWGIKFRAEWAVLNNPERCIGIPLFAEEDIKCIKADFLISHINSVFRQREKYEWSKLMSFEDFCEYLLPYRIDTETPILWRDSVVGGMDKFEKNYQFDNLNTSPNYIKSQLLSDLNIPWKEAQHILPFKKYSADCRDFAYYDLLRFRLCGIPAAIDEVPFWGNCNGRHMWAQAIDRRERATNMLLKFRRAVPKVYRKTYSRRLMTKQVTEYIPEYFQNPFFIDVTSEYLYTVSDVTEKGFGKAEYGYLCVSNGKEWEPVAQAVNHFGKCVFSDMGPDIVYLPVYFDGDRMVCVNSPFLLKRDGSKIYFYAADRKENITITRKYPLEDIHRGLMGAFSGVIEASIYEDFRKCDTVCSFSEGKTIMSPMKKKLGENKYTYFRISPTKHHLNISELSFFSQNRKRIYATPLVKLANDSLLQDGNVLSFINIKLPYILSIPQKEKVFSIHLLPRNDGNGIFPGNRYELFYFDKNRQWVSIGKQIADSYELNFEEVPTDALLLLRNLTQGKQERIFVYENGKQYFK